MDVYCKENNQTKLEINEEFDMLLKTYISRLKNHLSELLCDKVLLDCMPIISKETIENITNFDVLLLMETDNHIYSNNSKNVIIAFFNTLLNDIIMKVQNFNNSIKK